MEIMLLPRMDFKSQLVAHTLPVKGLGGDVRMALLDVQLCHTCRGLRTEWEFSVCVCHAVDLDQESPSHFLIWRGLIVQG